MTHPAETRQQAFDLLDSGVRITHVAKQLHISLGSLYAWMKEESFAWEPQYITREGTCDVGNCTKPIVAKRMCSMHYDRVQNYGTPDDPNDNLERRFLRRVVGFNNHALWTGNKNGIQHGQVYGVCRSIIPGEYAAHRVSYRLFVGDIPEGYHIDHLCCLPLCVWPPHLEAVPAGENTRRMIARGRAWWQKPNKDAVMEKMRGPRKPRTSQID